MVEAVFDYVSFRNLLDASQANQLPLFQQIGSALIDPYLQAARTELFDYQLNINQAQLGLSEATAAAAPAQTAVEAAQTGFNTSTGAFNVQQGIYNTAQQNALVAGQRVTSQTSIYNTLQAQSTDIINQNTANQAAFNTRLGQFNTAYSSFMSNVNAQITNVRNQIGSTGLSFTNDPAHNALVTQYNNLNTIKSAYGSYQYTAPITSGHAYSYATQYGFDPAGLNTKATSVGTYTELANPYAAQAQTALSTLNTYRTAATAANTALGIEATKLTSAQSALTAATNTLTSAQANLQSRQEVVSHYQQQLNQANLAYASKSNQLYQSFTSGLQGTTVNAQQLSQYVSPELGAGLPAALSQLAGISQADYAAAVGGAKTGTELLLQRFPGVAYAGGIVQGLNPAAPQETARIDVRQIATQSTPEGLRGAFAFELAKAISAAGFAASERNTAFLRDPRFEANAERQFLSNLFTDINQIVRSNPKSAGLLKYSRALESALAQSGNSFGGTLNTLLPSIGETPARYQLRLARELESRSPLTELSSNSPFLRIKTRAAPPRSFESTGGGGSISDILLGRALVLGGNSDLGDDEDNLR